jgi:hypothetical protein
MLSRRSDNTAKILLNIIIYNLALKTESRDIGWSSSSNGYTIDIKDGYGVTVGIANKDGYRLTVTKDDKCVIDSNYINMPKGDIGYLYELIRDVYISPGDHSGIEILREAKKLIEEMSTNN